MTFLLSGSIRPPPGGHFHLYLFITPEMQLHIQVVSIRSTDVLYSYIQIKTGTGHQPTTVWMFRLPWKVSPAGNYSRAGLLVFITSTTARMRLQLTLKIILMMPQRRRLYEPHCLA